MENLTQYFCFTENSQVVITKERPKERELLVNFRSFMAPKDAVASVVYARFLQTHKKEG